MKLRGPPARTLKHGGLGIRQPFIGSRPLLQRSGAVAWYGEPDFILSHFLGMLESLELRTMLGLPGLLSRPETRTLLSPCLRPLPWEPARGCRNGSLSSAVSAPRSF